MKSILTILGAAFVVLSTSLRADTFDPVAWKAIVPTDAQINAVAAMLPAKPEGVGRPITDRAAWATAMQQPYFQKQLKDAELYATQPIPDLGDTPATNFWILNVPFDLRSKRLIAFVIAECAQDDGKHLPLIEAELHAILTESAWSLMPGHRDEIDLAAAARGWTVATADYWLGDKLKPETRQLIRSELKKRIFDRYVADFKSDRPKWGWEMGNGSNWIAVCNSGVLGAALTVIDDPKERAFFVQTAQNSVAYYLKGMGDDGYDFEGIGYWGYGFGCYLCLAETLYEQTQGKINMFQGPKVRNMALFLKRMQMLPGVFAAWGDVWYRGNGSMEELNELINERWGMGWTDLDPSKSTMFATHNLGDRLFGFGLFGFPLPQYGDSPVAGSPATSEELAEGTLRTYFPDGKVLITRSQRPGAPDLGLAVKGGTNDHDGSGNKGHNHNDNGTYYVATKGVPLIVDPGMEIYTRDSFGPHRFESMMMNSYGHDVPYIGGTMQKSSPTALAVITDKSFTDDKDSITMDLTSSYDVPSLIKVTRTYVLDRTKPSVEITDTADFSAPTDYGSAFITGSKWTEKGPGSYLIYEKQSAVQTTVTLEDGSQTLLNKTEYLQMHQAGAGYHPMRLGFNLDKPVTHVVMHTTIVPVTAPPPAPTAPAPAAQTADDFFNQGWAKMHQSDWRGAVAAFDQAIKLDPGKVDAYLERGASKLMLGDHVGGMADYDQAIKVDPKNTEAYLKRGEALQMKDPKGAIADYQRVIALDPKNHEAYKDLATVKWMHQDNDGAIAAYDQLIALDPKDWYSYACRAMAKGSKGDWDGAIADYDQDILIEPTDFNAFHNRGQLKQKKGDLQGALADFNQAIALGMHDGYVYRERAGIKKVLGDWDGALADYDQVITLDPKNGDAFVNLDEAYFNRGNIKLAKRDLPEAIADYNQAIRLHAEDTQSAYFSIWVAQQLQGKKAEADSQLSSEMAKSAGFTWYWPSKISAFLLDQMSESDFMNGATSSDAKTDGIQHCQAWYYAGIKHLLAGDKSTAADDFRKCLVTNQKDESSYFFAEAELKAIEKQP